MSQIAVLNRLFSFLLISCCCLFVGRVSAQYSGFSLSSEFSLVRSFKKDQRFWGMGPGIRFMSHATPKESFYAFFGYYSPETVKNRGVAAAKLPTTTPAYLLVDNRSSIRLQQISLGYHRYFLGSCNREKGANVYGFGGLGIILGRVTNTPLVPIDTSLYTVPVLPGSSGFKRLTVDFGLGTEVNIGSQIYLYGEFKCWLPASSYSNPYMFVNEKAPVTGFFSGGLRVYFE